MHQFKQLFSVIPFVISTPLDILRISSWDSSDDNLLEALTCDGDATLTSLTADQVDNLSASDLKKYDVVFIAVGNTETEMTETLADKLVEYVKNGGGLFATGLFNFVFRSTREKLKDVC